MDKGEDQRRQGFSPLAILTAFARVSVDGEVCRQLSRHGGQGMEVGSGISVEAFKDLLSDRNGVLGPHRYLIKAPFPHQRCQSSYQAQQRARERGLLGRLKVSRPDRHGHRDDRSDSDRTG